MRELEAWKKDVERSLARIPGLTVGKLSIGHSLGSLMSLRGGVTYQGANIEFVKVDVACIWGKYLAEDLKAFHSFVDGSEGFEFHFIALDSKSQYITGVFSVKRKPAGVRL